MAWQLPEPRKQRTRQHVIAAQSVNYVERFIVDEGFTAQRLEADYGYDLLLATFDEQGYIEPGYVTLQLKASEALRESDGAFAFDLDVRDYNLWMLEPLPVILVLFDAAKRKAYWLNISRYFRELSARRPRKGAKTVRVFVPKRQAISRRAIARMRLDKQEILERSGEGEHDGHLRPT